MKKIHWLISVLGLFLVPAASTPCLALTATELDAMLARGEKLTIIDVRNQALYGEGHIPGAINIPAAIIGKKHLPPFGVVVVYGDGIHGDQAIDAMIALEQKPGIQPQLLDGGFGAWQTMKLTTTHAPGLGKSQLQYLTYQEFEKLAATDVDIVLVDLRQAEAATPAGHKSGTGLTNLAEKFPLVKTVKIPRRQGDGDDAWNFSSLLSAKGKAHYQKNLYVLVDDGDEAAKGAAQRLMAAGIKRLAVLTGGEEALARQGIAGEERSEIRQEIGK